MRIALVEDNELHRNQIVGEIEAFFRDMNEACELRIFSNGSELLDCNDDIGGFDLMLLDIRLPGIDGLSVAREIRKKDDKVIIVFITSMTAYAVQGYSVHAMDYILKPINRISFRNMLERARELFRQKMAQYISVSTAEGLLKLDVSQIYYIETENHAVRLYHTKGSFRVNNTMKSLEEQLKNANFCRCNNCYLVNLAHVEQVKKGFVIVHEYALSFSRQRYKKFMEALTNYLGGVHK